MNGTLVVIVALTIGVLGILFIKRVSIGFRFCICLLYALAMSGFGLVCNLTADRAAEVKIKSLGQIPNPDWVKGAIAARHAASQGIIFWLIAVGTLVVLAAYVLNCRRNARQ